MSNSEVDDNPEVDDISHVGSKGELPKLEEFRLGQLSS